MSKNQRLVHKGTGLKARMHNTNQELPPEKRCEKHTGKHLWGCPGCGMRNDPWFMSCRYCQTLKWGVKP